MAPANLPYTFAIRKKSGTELWYFRHPSLEKPARIPARPGEAAFHREYTRLLADATETKVAAEQSADTASVRWLVGQYKKSNWWAELSAKSKTDYSRELDRLCVMAGDLPFARLTAQGVWSLRERVMQDVAAARLRAVAEREAKDAARNAQLNERDAKLLTAGKTIPPRPKSKRKPPKATSGARTADLFKATLSAMMTWAREAQHVTASPVERMRRLNRKSSVTERLGWTEYQIEFALKHAPRPIRDGIVIGLHIGQRLGDCCKLRKAQCIGPIVRLRQSKTGTPIDIIATGPLVNIIARRRGANEPDDAKELLVQDNGEPYSERLFSEHLRNWLDEQGWEDLSFHGLRYAAAGTLNEAGATVATIVTILGHRTYQMALKYLAQREESKRAAALMQEASDRRES